MTIQTVSVPSERELRRFRAREANKVGLWILLGAVAAALLAGVIYAAAF